MCMRKSFIWRRTRASYGVPSVIVPVVVSFALLGSVLTSRLSSSTRHGIGCDTDLRHAGVFDERRGGFESLDAGQSMGG
jgi:hypothetical protein